MSVCGILKKNMLYDCARPAIGGTEAYIYLFNRSDIVGYVRDVTNPQIISDITLRVVTPAVAGQNATPAVLAKGFRYEGINTSVKPKVAFVKKDYSAKYDHTLGFVVFAKGSAVKAEIEKLGLNRVVAVVENVQKNGDSAFEIYGTDLGLELKTLTVDPNDANSEGAAVIELSSPDNFKEPHMPATYYDGTSYATTKAAIDALITPVA